MTTNNVNPGEATSTINVTPMIDILLVLLIIFMVIVPALPRGESALVPKPSLSGQPSGQNPVVLEVLKDSAGKAIFRINRQDVAREDLAARLAAIYENRARRTMFVKGDGQLRFTEIAEAIDIAHSAGVDQVGLITPGVQAGP